MPGIRHLERFLVFCGLLLSLSACQLPETILSNTSPIGDQTSTGLTATEELVPACSVDVPCGLTPEPSEMRLTPTILSLTPVENPFIGCNAYSDTLMEGRILEIINMVRTEEGLGLLVPENRLEKAALLHALDISCNGSVSHTGSDGSTLADRLARQGYPYQVYAENIYAGGAGTPEAAVDAMMASIPHRANILNAEFTEVGISYVVLEGSSYGSYYVIDFGAQ